MNKEIGSSFYTLLEGDQELSILSEHKVTLIKEQYSYYYSGRNAYLSLLKEISLHHEINKIWLPKYFCKHVLANISRNYNNVHYYETNPFNFENDIDISQFTKKNEIIVLNNYWGLSTFSYNSKAIDRPIIIEDHSHGWLSKQCISSKADYCICSIRKTYPIPVGGIAWKPNSNKNSGIYSDKDDATISEAYKKINESMHLKRRYIKENIQDIKETYLSLLKEGEAFISDSNKYARPTNKILNTIQSYMDLNPNIIKNKNLNYVSKHLVPSKHFKLIKREGFTPFGLLILFKDLNRFHSFKKCMITNNIYPAHLWPNNELKSQWKYILNIHVDYRYDLNSMAYISKTINKWAQLY